MMKMMIELENTHCKGYWKMTESFSEWFKEKFCVPLWHDADHTVLTFLSSYDWNNLLLCIFAWNRENFYIQLNSAITDLPQNCDYFDKSQLKNFLQRKKKDVFCYKEKKRSISISRFCLHLKDGRKKKEKIQFWMIL